MKTVEQTIDTAGADTKKARASKLRIWLFKCTLLFGVGLALVTLFLLGSAPRHANAEKLARQAAGRTAPAYQMIHAARGNPQTSLSLPGTVEAIQETPIYARASGYIKSYHADIGAKVSNGDPLAEIETPEIDEQLNQAKAALDQAKAELALAEVSNRRWNDLLQRKAVSQQEADERKATFAARQADVAAQQANVERLLKVQAFQKVTAPFAGTITARNIEIGELVRGEDNSRLLFRLAQTDTLRVFVQVPQTYYRLVASGMPVKLVLREFPEKAFAGKVVRTAGAIEPQTRTLLTEIHVPNQAGELVPGLYADVQFQLNQAQPPITVPAAALLFQPGGPAIATVDSHDAVQLRAVTLGRDFGKTLEILAGLKEGERIIVNPTDTLKDGAIVEGSLVAAQSQR